MKNVPDCNDRPPLVSPRVGSDYYLLDFGALRPVLSSAAIGGGLGKKRYLMSRSVQKNWPHSDPLGDTIAYIQRIGYDPAQTVGLMTSVFVGSLRLATATAGDWLVTACVTAGVGNAAVAGNAATAAEPGTINIVILLHGLLTEAGMIGAVQMATEAKVRALHDAGIQVGEHHATGTSTDTVTIVGLNDTPTSPYAGHATDVGYAIGRAVFAATAASLEDTQARRRARENTA